MATTMTRSEALANLKRYGAMVDVLRIKRPNCPKTIQAIRDHAALLDKFCPSCVGTISTEDVVELVDGKRYHSGCEPY